MSRKLVILMFHRVLNTPDALRSDEFSVRDFERYCRILRRFFNVVSLSEGISKLSNGSLPPRAVSITFDDGYADNLHIAAPVLQQFSLPATVFVAAGFLDGGRMWNDTVIESFRLFQGDSIDLRDLGLGQFDLSGIHERASAIGKVLLKMKYMPPAERDNCAMAIEDRVSSPLPTNLMLSTDELHRLASQGFEIGAHTVTHPILNSVDLETATEEIRAGRRYLENMLGEPVKLFAYPNGKPGKDYGAVHVDIVRAMGFLGGVSTLPGAASVDDDIHQLPRYGPWVEGSGRFLLRMLRLFV